MPEMSRLFVYITQVMGQKDETGVVFVIDIIGVASGTHEGAAKPEPHLNAESGYC